MATNHQSPLLSCRILLAYSVVHAAAFLRSEERAPSVSISPASLSGPRTAAVPGSAAASNKSSTAAEATGTSPLNTSAVGAVATGGTQKTSAALPRPPLANESLAFVRRPKTSSSTGSTQANQEDTSVYDQENADAIPSWAYAVMFVGALALCWKLNAISSAIYGLFEKTEEETTAPLQGYEPEDTVEDHIEMPEDLYGVVLGCLIWDTYAIEKGFASWQIRRTRMVFVVLLHLFGVALQVAILLVITYFGSQKAVYDIRKAYSEFERTMYGTNVYLTEYGFYRGKGKEYFLPAMFDTLDDNLKSDVCRIPFTQPLIIILILFLWSLIVLGDVKDTLKLIERLVWRTERSAQITENETEESDGAAITVSKMPLCFKIFLGYGILFPRLLVDACLLWLGCRWLSATRDFGGLILNACAMEFILLLPELSYKTIVSDLNKRDACRVCINTTNEKTFPTMKGFFLTLVWGLMALIWSSAYVYKIQNVLPSYRWDVKDVCAHWMTVNYAG
jgi:hypothetical protein